jgi:hypothetical protein
MIHITHIFYLIFNLCIDQFYTYKFKNNIISFIHALITSIYSNYLMITDDKFFDISLYTYEEVHPYYLSTSIYTIIYLFFHIKSALKLDNSIKIHAFMMSIMSFISIYYEKMHYFSIALIIESSTIFLQIMHINKNIYSKLLFVLSFSIYRGLLFPYICYHFLMNHYEQIITIFDIHFVFFILSVISNGLNFYWLRIIFIQLYNLVFEQEKKKK